MTSPENLELGKLSSKTAVDSLLLRVLVLQPYDLRLRFCVSVLQIVSLDGGCVVTYSCKLQFVAKGTGILYQSVCGSTSEGISYVRSFSPKAIQLSLVHMSRSNKSEAKNGREGVVVLLSSCHDGIAPILRGGGALCVL